MNFLISINIGPLNIREIICLITKELSRQKSCSVNAELACPWTPGWPLISQRSICDSPSAMLTGRCVASRFLR